MYSNFFSRSAAALVIQLFATTALGICVGDANISAEPMTDPGASGWQYTLTVEWSYGDYGMSTWGIFLDGPASECNCNTIQTEISIPALAGNSVSTSDGCTVPYSGYLECGPDAPNPNWIMLTFYPDPEAVCSMPSGGITELSFYSILPPQPVAVDAQLLLDNSCLIHVTGVLPTFACEPVSAEAVPWGSVKSIYR